VSSNIESQLKTLRLTYPFTKQELTRSYRTRAFVCHPDKGGESKEFIKVQDAYDLLLPMCVLVNEKDVITHTTVEGDLIYNLGKGLEGLINSKDCSECQGNGWFKSIHTTYSSEIICPVCGGTGQIITTRNSILFWLNWRPCRRCKGSGYLGFTEIKHETLHTCIRCEGNGQTPIHNPVLRKDWMHRQKQANKHKIRRYCDYGARLVSDKCWRCERVFAKI